MTISQGVIPEYLPVKIGRKTISGKVCPAQEGENYRRIYFEASVDGEPVDCVGVWSVSAILHAAISGKPLIY